MVDRPTSAPLGDPRGEVDEDLVSSRPPPTFVLVRRWTVQTPRELFDLRADVLAEVAPGGADQPPELDSLAHHIVLVASELATNALRHGIAPTVVALLREGGTYLLDVADHDLSTTPYLAGERPPGQGGFGLQIARRLATDVGWYPTDVAKHVWARFG